MKFHRNIGKRDKDSNKERDSSPTPSRPDLGQLSVTIPMVHGNVKIKKERDRGDFLYALQIDYPHDKLKYVFIALNELVSRLSSFSSCIWAI